jgi:hypothetical protein
MSEKYLSRSIFGEDSFHGRDRCLFKWKEVNYDAYVLNTSPADDGSNMLTSTVFMKKYMNQYFRPHRISSMYATPTPTWTEFCLQQKQQDENQQVSSHEMEVKELVDDHTHVQVQGDGLKHCSGVGGDDATHNSSGIKESDGQMVTPMQVEEVNVNVNRKRMSTRQDGRVASRDRPHVSDGGIAPARTVGSESVAYANTPQATSEQVRLST